MKKNHCFYTILSAGLFLLTSFVFFEFICELCHMIGSIVSGVPSQALYELKRILPITLFALTLVYMGCYCFAAVRNSDAGKRAGIWRINGGITIALGAFNCLYIIAGLCLNIYENLLEGYPTRLFPLDFAVYSLGLCLYGVFAIRFGGFEEKNEFYSFNISSKFRLLHYLSYMVAEFSFAAFIYCIFILDWSHGYIGYNILVMLIYLSAFAMWFCHRYIYAERQEKGRLSLWLGLLFLLLNAGTFVIYIVYVNKYNEAPNQNAFGVLPVDFTASFNAFLVIMGLNNLLAPLIACAKGLFTFKAK